MTTTQSAERKVSRGSGSGSGGEAKRDEGVTPPVAAAPYKTTMAAYGDKLPVGILDANGALHKDIVCKPWRTRDERELGKKVAADTTMIEHVPLVVANMCSRIGPHNMDTISDAEKGVIVSTMYMADVFYAYALLRSKTMGQKLSLTVNCPRMGCGASFPFAGDLSSVEVVAVDDIDSILWRYDLEDPIEIRKKCVTHFQMAYPKWSVMEAARGNPNEVEVKAYAIQGTVIGLNDEQTPVALTLNELDELSKRDFEGVQEAINNHFLGPKMGIEGKCTPAVCERFKRGGYEFKVAIDWNYRNFFGASSR